jgi:hypothetical protein
MDCIDVLLEVSLWERKSQFDPKTEEAMQSALDVQSTSLETSRSTTAGHISHSCLELRRVQKPQPLPQS